MKKTETLTEFPSSLKIAIGSDHAGFHRKAEIISWLKTQKIAVVDVGVFDSKVKSDYPLYGNKVSLLVANQEVTYGLLVCYSGAGMAIAANRFKAIRAFHCYANQPEMITLARQHNDVNLLTFSAHFLTLVTTIKLLKIFLTTNFLKLKRYQRRNALLKQST